VSDFGGLHTRKHDAEVQLYAFDCLALDGDDLRKLPLSLRKTNLARLLARRPDGILVVCGEALLRSSKLWSRLIAPFLDGAAGRERNR
jgi:bifunctional non-homologous end joining protein LigD